MHDPLYKCIYHMCCTYGLQVLSGSVIDYLIVLFFCRSQHFNELIVSSQFNSIEATKLDSETANRARWFISSAAGTKCYLPY